LDALLPQAANGLDAAVKDSLSQVGVDLIDGNPFQPRKTFDDDELSSLQESIRHHGILQPLVVRQQGTRFQLVAGERRLRAARAAGLMDVPVRIVDFNDQQVLEAALVENIQRADLNPIEKAQGFRDYLDRFQMKHEELAARIGIARTTLSNLLGLLELPQEIQDRVRTGQISVGHAKILKGINDPERQLAFCRQFIAQGISVHAAEALVKQPVAPAEPAPGVPREVVEKTSHLQGIEDELRQKLALRVEVRLTSQDKGQIILRFESNDDFERLLEVLRR
jgi:ParB family chromosome partitioning protein